MILFLHTSAIHIKKFEKLVRKYNQDIVVKHVVNEDLLISALEKGRTDTLGFNQQIKAIENQNPELIICTCSTYGQECDPYTKVLRIDYPIAEFLVMNYKKIGLVYTAKSTQKVSEDLIYKTATEKKKDVQILNCDCTDSWKFYECNDFVNYSKSIAKKVLEIEYEVDVIFLAQASMEGTKDYIKNFSKDIFSSSEFGVKTYLKRLIK